MPLPSPSGMSEKDYIQACMHAQSGEDKPQEQKLAICYSNYREHHQKQMAKEKHHAELESKKHQAALPMGDNTFIPSDDEKKKKY